MVGVTILSYMPFRIGQLSFERPANACGYLYPLRVFALMPDPRLQGHNYHSRNSHRTTSDQNRDKTPLECMLKTE